MGDDTAVMYKRERSPLNKGSIYLPQKQGTNNILYIHIDDPPLDLSRRNRKKVERGDAEREEVVLAVDSPIILTPEDYSNADLSQPGSAANFGRKATPTANLSGAAKLYKCCECDYVSKRSYDVRRHMKTHGNTRPYGCPQCAHTARDAGSLKAHMLEKHGNLDQYVCPRCDYSSNRQAELARHIRTNHESR